jgi:hypothetical protein
MNNHNKETIDWLTNHQTIFIYISISIILMLVVGLYISVFTKKSIKEPLYIGGNSAYSALKTTSSFTTLTTYYNEQHSLNGDFNGSFLLQVTEPENLDLQVMEGGVNITSTVLKGSTLGQYTTASFRSTGGDVILQYKNTSSTNYLLRLDVQIN